MTELKDLFEFSTLNQCAYECTRQSRWKETTQRYLSNLLVNNLELQEEVLEGRYKVRPTVNFDLNERGHLRHIKAPVVRDRIVQKTLAKNVVAPALTKPLVYDNYASLPGRGTSFARKRFEIMLRRFFNEHGRDGYILLIDIKKYFDSIDHEVLKSLIDPRLSSQPQEVVDLIHYTIDKSSPADKGIELGSELPQIFAIYYLHAVDSFVKIVKGVKFYGRYMDDIYVVGKSKEELKQLLFEIETVLSRLKLETNKRKTHLIRLSHSFTFLQIKYNITESGKILKRPSRSKIVRERRRLKAFRRMVELRRMTIGEVSNCYKSWRGSFIRDHNACYKTLISMDNLYNSLFPTSQVPKLKPGRKVYVDYAYRHADTRDLTHCLTYF